LDDALVNWVITLFTNQRDNQGLFDEQIARWEKMHPTRQQLAEITRLKEQMQEWHSVVDAILALAEELKEQTIERLLEKDEAEIGLEYLLGTLGKRKTKPTK
jgi:Tfp pilus assembly protein PilN